MVNYRKGRYDFADFVLLQALALEEGLPVLEVVVNIERLLRGRATRSSSSVKRGV
jgi:hypothetical protein